MDITASGNTVIDNVNIDGVPNGRGIKMTTNGSAEINAVIKNCTTTENGGGIYISGTGSANVSGTKIIECRTGSGGGGLYISGAGSANISNTEITECRAYNRGGGMYLTCSGNVIISNTSIDGAALTTLNGQGGGIYRSGGGLKVNNNSVIKRISGGGYECAGIYQTGYDLEISGLELQNISGCGIYKSDLNLQKGNVNLSGINASNIGSTTYGFGFYFERSTSFYLNSSKINGCGVYCNILETVQVIDTQIYNAPGYSYINNYNTKYTFGVLVVNSEGQVSMDRVTVDGVSNGDGILISTYKDSKISNCVIRNIHEVGLLFDGNNMVYENTTIENCGEGGVYSWGNFFMQSGQIFNNHGFGGVTLYGVGNNFTMNGGEIYNNTSDSEYGGGVSCWSFYKTGGTIYGNDSNKPHAVYTNINGDWIDFKLGPTDNYP
jgi:hypothetical protein